MANQSTSEYLDGEYPQEFFSRGKKVINNEAGNNQLMQTDSEGF